MTPQITNFAMSIKTFPYSFLNRLTIFDAKVGVSPVKTKASQRKIKNMFFKHHIPSISVTIVII